MPKEDLKLVGRLSIVLRKKDGTVKDRRDCENLVVDTGLEFIAGRMVDAGAGVMTHMALGSGTAAAAAQDTSLAAQLDSREALASTTVNPSDETRVDYSALFPAGVGTGAVTEAGIFDAATSGVMLCRTVFAPVNKGPDDTLSITWSITVGA